MKTAVLGATGLVGRAMLKLLEGCSWLSGDPLLLASSRSAGSKLRFRGRELTVQEVTEDSFSDVDIALFSGGGATSRTWGPVATGSGTWVIDNSSAFRTQESIPLVVPEINGSLVQIRSGGGGGLIANPNCSTIQVAMAVAPLNEVFGLREVHVTTMQAVSGGGRKAVEELERQVAGQPSSAGDDEVFPQLIAANVIPAIGSALDDGSYEEENKVVKELRKILGRGTDLAVTCTAVRVPVINGHSAAVRVVCDRPVDLEAAHLALGDRPGLEVTNDPHDYLTPRQVDGQRIVHVGRVRLDPADDRALLCWVVADNLLKGAAWNAVQIAELLAREPAS
ncbi:MAG: aspartate-semialdehyde dehydrogenase [Gemmatimonadales bacterium]|nr:aspartate-semialdehyde dehydrogenase [Gemmatimonadales bacterium]